jgi:hypothetical protein
VSRGGIDFRKGAKPYPNEGIKMKMKDILSKEAQRYFKSSYLETTVKKNDKQVKAYKQLRGLGMPSWKAYQLSRR